MWKNFLSSCVAIIGPMLALTANADPMLSFRFEELAEGMTLTVEGSFDTEGMELLGPGLAENAVYSDGTSPSALVGTGDYIVYRLSLSSSEWPDFDEIAELAITTTSGDRVGFEFSPGSFLLSVPVGYVSGDPLSATATWEGQTFATMSPARRGQSWGWYGGGLAIFMAYEGIDPIGASDWLFFRGVPEPGTAVLFGLGLASLAVWSRKVHSRA